MGNIFGLSVGTFIERRITLFPVSKNVSTALSVNARSRGLHGMQALEMKGLILQVEKWPPNARKSLAMTGAWKTSEKARLWPNLAQHILFHRLCGLPC
jgi:hypothetical protein